LLERFACGQPSQRDALCVGRERLSAWAQTGRVLDPCRHADRLGDTRRQSWDDARRRRQRQPQVFVNEIV
jgi:hypothetical protein